jgi:3-hydroxybutyryl-CoA dehydrogenase
MDANRIDRTAVIGGGLMGAGFAHILAQAGCRVCVVDLSDQLVEKCLRRVEDSLHLFARHGFLPEGELAAIMARIEGTTSLEKAACDAQFIVEAAVEDLAVKQGIFEKLDRLTPEETILATNTSSLKVGDIAQRVSRPERVVGSHFFYPHTVVPLVEVVYGPETSDGWLRSQLASGGAAAKSRLCAGRT